MVRKTLVFLALIVFFSLRAQVSSCALSNGTYQIVYDEHFSDKIPFQFKVINNIAIEIKDKRPQKFKIEKLDPSTFKLIPEIPISKNYREDRNLSSYGQPYFKINKCTDEALFVTKHYTANLIAYTGKLIKIKRQLP